MRGTFGVGRIRQIRGSLASLVGVTALLCSSAVIALAACSSDDGGAAPSTADGGGGANTSGGGSCASETRADTYAVGLEKVTPSGVRVRMLDATPAPPAKNENSWTLQVLAADGTPIDDATITITPFMPDHAHGSAVTPEITAVGSEGKYTVKRVYLPMAGFWTMTVLVGNEQVVFGFCIEG
jgi:hypothetical protein